MKKTKQIHVTIYKKHKKTSAIYSLSY